MLFLLFNCHRVRYLHSSRCSRLQVSICYSLLASMFFMRLCKLCCYYCLTLSSSTMPLNLHSKIPVNIETEVRYEVEQQTLNIHWIGFISGERTPRKYVHVNIMILTTVKTGWLDFLEWRRRSFFLFFFFLVKSSCGFSLSLKFCLISSTCSDTFLSWQEKKKKTERHVPVSFRTVLLACNIIGDISRSSRAALLGCLATRQLHVSQLPLFSLFAQHELSVCMSAERERLSDKHSTIGGTWYSCSTKPRFLIIQKAPLTDWWLTDD